MISSMTGFGRGEVSEKHITATAEVRTENNRFLEIAVKLPRIAAKHESEVKELVRGKFARGKVNVMLNISYDTPSALPLKINKPLAKAYFKLLDDLRKTVKTREKITLNHLLNFPEVLEIDELGKSIENEWNLCRKALSAALDETAIMRKQEGGELMKDLAARVNDIDRMIENIESIAINRIPEEKLKLEKRLKELVTDQSIIDAKRLELEISLMVDKLDVTEECVRFRSHNKFFLNSLDGNDVAGRKLNFLVQEMNREANTIGSKVNNAEIAHYVIAIKEELEKIREQLQNIE